jgi:NhaA family Na+:H+ antiporter
MLAALVAVAWANSPLAEAYQHMLHWPVGLLLGHSTFHGDLHFVVNDALMAIFFLLVGLEIRHEVTAGQLNSVRRAAAPLVAAVGGMVVPALIYVACTWRDPGGIGGWAIPTATDIAFSLAVLRLLGPAVPGGLRVFMTALAIIDDLGAILIIAFFFTSGLNVVVLGAALLVWLALAAAARLGVRSITMYLVGFVALWVLVVQSGIHATLAGVALAFAVPMDSVGHKLEHALRGWVAFVVLPLFALFNAGLSFSGMGLDSLLDPVVPGIVLGLFVGKPLGVFGFTWVATRLRLITLPPRLSWRMLFGAAALCGIGFTMSLFIGLLAFPDGDRATELKLGVFIASLASAALGARVVASATRPRLMTPARPLGEARDKGGLA